MAIDYELLQEMIDCVKREVSFRYAVYPKRVRMGKMTEAETQKEIHLMYGVQKALQKIYDGQAPEEVQKALFDMTDFKAEQKTQKQWYEV